MAAVERTSSSRLAPAAKERGADEADGADAPSAADMVAEAPSISPSAPSAAQPAAQHAPATSAQAFSTSPGLLNKLYREILGVEKRLVQPMAASSSAWSQVAAPTLPATGCRAFCAAVPCVRPMLYVQSHGGAARTLQQKESGCTSGLAAWRKVRKSTQIEGPGAPNVAVKPVCLASILF